MQNWPFNKLIYVIQNWPFNKLKFNCYYNKKVDIKLSAHDAFLDGIALIRCAQNLNMSKLNSMNVFRRKNAKGPTRDSHNLLEVTWRIIVVLIIIYWLRKCKLRYKIYLMNFTTIAMESCAAIVVLMRSKWNTPITFLSLWILPEYGYGFPYLHQYPYALKMSDY